MSKLTLGIGIAIGIVMFTIGALAGHTVTTPWNATAKLQVQQMAPFEMMARTRGLPVQTVEHPF